MTPFISVTGFKNSGKTTVVEGIVRQLTRSGLRVGTVKDAKHGFTLDEPGKDSWRHREAGATTVVIASDSVHGVVAQYPVSLDSLHNYFSDVDLVITEGYRSAAKPKLEVCSGAALDAGRPLLALNDPTVAAVLTDDQPAVETRLREASRHIPLFARDDYEGIARFVMTTLLPPLVNLVAIVLAGGKSERMGTDKAFLQLGDENLLTRQLRRLGRVARDIVVVSTEPGKFSHLGVQVVCDSALGNGPLAGLHAGLRAAGNRPCIVAGVDMPFYNLDLAVYAALLLAGAYGQNPRDIVFPVDARARLEPLHAAYSPSCLQNIEDLFEREPNPSFRDLKAEADTLVLDPVAVSRFGDPAFMFFNINTSSELERARDLLENTGYRDELY